MNPGSEMTKLVWEQIEKLYENPKYKVLSDWLSEKEQLVDLSQFPQNYYGLCESNTRKPKFVWLLKKQNGIIDQGLGKDEQKRFETEYEVFAKKTRKRVIQFCETHCKHPLPFSIIVEFCV